MDRIEAQHRHSPTASSWWNVAVVARQVTAAVPRPRRLSGRDDGARRSESARLAVAMDGLQADG